MHEKKTVLAVVVITVTMFLTGTVWAAIPAPPANQGLGFDDTIFNNLLEADCRVCHDDPGIAGATPNVDRHHLLYGTLLPQGECSVNSNACLSDADCNPAICSSPPVEACIVDTDCDNAGVGETCGEVCIGETVVPILDADQDGADDTNYGCLNCHEQTLVGGVITFLVERNCLQCHIQIPGEGSVHHLTPVAQGLNSPLGDPAKGDCTPCHGTVVDDIGDGHTIPTYSPSMVTPKPSGGNAEPLNTRSNGAGACDYCHDAGLDTLSGVQVVTNADTHHNTGVFQSETGVTNESACLWCHNLTLPDESLIRTCEGCHGLDSLHNIQDDSNGDCCIVIGGELPGYGHIGADDPTGTSDCWGCHGFSSAAAPGSGPIAPFINSSDLLVITAGIDTAITLTGSSFTNTYGAFSWTSSFVLTSEDGTELTLQPDAIDACSCTVTIPATTPVGNYELRAVKYAAENAESNPVVISIIPGVVITSISCNQGEGILTIAGSGFGDAPPAGAEEFINVKVRNVPLEIISWTDTEIRASVSSCTGTITVTTLYSSTSSYDACCEGDFDRDVDVDGSDAFIFKANFGRNDCTALNPCSGDLDCDLDVDGTDAVIFKEDFGRRDCSLCSPCTY